MRMYVFLLAALMCSAAASAQKKAPKAHIIQNETLIISPSGDKTTIEVSKAGVYVDGRLVATREELDNPNLKKKIIVGAGGDERAVTPRARAMLGLHTKGDYQGNGAYVTDVSDGSAADDAGLKRGDVITGINDEVIRSAQDLVQTIRSYEPGERVTVTYIRHDRERTTTATLDAMETRGTVRLFDNRGENGTTFDVEAPGFNSLVLDELCAPKPKLGVSIEDNEDGPGARVTNVRPGMPAEKADIREGDVITQIDNENVRGAKDLQEKMAGKEPGNTVKAEVQRGTLRMYKQIKLPKEKRGL